MTKNKNSKLIYSTNNDVSIEDKEEQSQIKLGNTIYIERDRKKRRGKIVTVVSKVPGNLKELLKELQKECGAGGSVKKGNIEVQGDHRDKIAALLKGRGYNTKYKGG